jgi:hypothetical protein
VLIVTLISALAAVVSVAVAIWTYFATRKVAEVRYEISQLADYQIPASFLEGLPRAPIMLRAESTGNKAAENVTLVLKVKPLIINCHVEPPIHAPSVVNGEVRLCVARLNPGQSVRIFLECNGDPTSDQVESTEFTHSEGSARLYSGTQEPPVFWNRYLWLGVSIAVAIAAIAMLLQTVFVPKKDRSPEVPSQSAGTPRASAQP